MEKYTEGALPAHSHAMELEWDHVIPQQMEAGARFERAISGV